nr:DDT domain-containing protein PTM-like isoform X1 [Ipomoea trifida]
MPRGSLLLRTVCPRTKKRGTKAKLPQSQNNTKVTVVVPLRRSARRAKIVQVQEKNANKKVGRPRRNLLVLSGELDATIDSPKCSLCSELESTPTVNYMACELCGGMVVPFFISSFKSAPVCATTPMIRSGEAKLAELKSDDGIECAGFHLVQAHIHQEGKQ